MPQITANKQDLDLLDKLGETGLTSQEVADAIKVNADILTGRTDTFVESGLEIAIDNQEKFEELAGLQSSASEIDGSVNLAHPSLNSFLYQIKDKSRSMAIFVNSDSTGNGNDEWVYFFAQWLATNYPEYTIRYRIWNDTTNVYENPISLNTGTSAYFIDIWNFAVAGSQPFHCLNVNRKKNGLLDIINPTIYVDSSTTIDLCIINHGHNVWNSPDNYTNVLRHAIFTEEFINIHPYSSLMYIRQNPFRDNWDNKARIQFAVDWAKRKNICVANVWDKFIALNKDTSLYGDNIHPSTGLGTINNPTGSRLFLDAVTEELSRKFNFKYVSYESFQNRVTKSYCSNSKLTHTNDSLPPDGFTVSGGTSIKDTVEFIDDSKGYSTKIIATGGVPCYLDYNVPTSVFNKLKGKILTCSILVKSDIEISSQSYCRIAFITNTKTFSDSVILPLNGSWNWRYNSLRVNTSDTYVKVRIYLDSANTVIAGKTINIDKVIISDGALPSGYALN